MNAELPQEPSDGFEASPPAKPIQPNNAPILQDEDATAAELLSDLLGIGQRTMGHPSPGQPSLPLDPKPAAVTANVIAPEPATAVADASSDEDVSAVASHR